MHIPDDTWVPEFLKLDYCLRSVDDLGPDRRLAERLRRFGKTQQTIDLRKNSDGVKPDRVALVEFSEHLHPGQQLAFLKKNGTKRAYLESELVDRRRLPLPRLFQLANELFDFRTPVTVVVLHSKSVRWIEPSNQLPV
jgi:hypothetical protein